MSKESLQDRIEIKVQINSLAHCLELEITKWLNLDAEPSAMIYHKTLSLNAKGQFDTNSISLGPNSPLAMPTVDAALLSLPGIQSSLILQSDGTLVLSDLNTDMDLVFISDNNILIPAPIKVRNLSLQAKNILIHAGIEADQLLVLQPAISVQNYKNLKASNIQIIGNSHLYNEGLIQATESFLIETCSVDNQGSMLAKVFSVQLNYNPALPIEPLSEFPIYMNNAGVLMGSECLEVNVLGNILNQGSGQILAMKSLFIKTLAQFTNALGGQVLTKGRLLVDMGELLNNGLLSGVESVILASTRKFDNAGIIQSFQEMTLVSQQTLENQSSGKIMAETFLKMRSHNKFQNAGLMVAKDLLSIHSEAMIHNSDTGKILSSSTVKILTLGFLENLGDITGYTSVSTQTQKGTLNARTANIRGADLLLWTLGDLNNQGNVRAKECLTTQSESTHNSLGAILASKNNAELQSYLVLMNAGKISANTLLIKAGSLINALETGEIFADSTLSLEIQHQMNNQNNIHSEGALNVSVKQLDNAPCANISSKGNTKMTVSKINNLGLFEATQLFLKAAVNLCNSETARLVARQTLKVISEGSIANQGKILSQGTVSLEAMQGIVNTLKGHIQAEEWIALSSKAYIQNAAGILSRGDLLIQALQQFTNLAESVIEAEHIKVKTNLVANQGLLHASKTLNIEANIIFENLLRGLIFAGEKLELFSKCWMENNGGIVSGAELVLKADKILKNLKTGQVVAGADLQLLAGHVLSNAGAVQGMKNILFQAGHCFSNDFSAQLSAKGNLDIKSDCVIRNAGTINARTIEAKATLLLENLVDSTLAAEEKLKLLSDFAIENAGLLKAENIYMQSQLLNNLTHAEVVASAQLEANAAILVNQGNCQAQGNLSLNSEIFWNLSTGKISTQQALAVLAKRHLDNHGLIVGDKTYLMAEALSNHGTLGAFKKLFLPIADILHAKQGTLVSEAEIEILSKNLHLLGSVMAKEDLNISIEKFLNYSPQGLQATGLLKLMLKAEQGFNFRQPIDTPGALRIESPATININTTIKTGGSFKLSAAHIQLQSGGIQAAASATVQAAEVLQTSRGTYLVSQQAMSLSAHTIYHQGELYTQSDLLLKALALIENAGNIYVNRNASLIAPLLQHGRIGNQIKPIIHVAGDCTLAKACIHDAEIRVGGQLKAFGPTEFRSTELEAQKAATEAARRKAKKKKRLQIFKTIGGVCLGAFTVSFMPGVAPIFKGMVFGGISSGVSGRNPLEGAISGGFFAGFGQAFNIGLTKLGDTYQLMNHEILKEAIIAGGTASLSTAIHGGNYWKNLAVGVGASVTISISLPRESLETRLDFKDLIVEIKNEALRAGIIGGFCSVVHKTRLAENLISVGIGVSQAFAGAIGHNAALHRQEQQALAAKPKAHGNSIIAKLKPILADNTQVKEQRVKERAKTAHLTFANISEELEQFYIPSHSNPVLEQRQGEVKLASDNLHISRNSRQQASSVENGKSEVLTQQLVLAFEPNKHQILHITRESSFSEKIVDFFINPAHADTFDEISAPNLQGQRGIFGEQLLNDKTPADMADDILSGRMKGLIRTQKPFDFKEVCQEWRQQQGNSNQPSTSKMLLFSSQAPKTKTAIERRDELNKAIYGEYAIAQSNEATLVLGGVSGIVKGAVHFGMAVASAAQDGVLAFSPGISETVKMAARERSQNRVETINDFITHMPQRVSEGLVADFRRASDNYEKGNYFQVGENLSSFTLIASPATLSSAYQLANLGVKATSLTARTGAKGLEIATKSIHEFVSTRTFRSPVTFQFDQAITQLNSGFSIANLAQRSLIGSKNISPEEFNFYSKANLISKHSYKDPGILSNKRAVTFLGDRYTTYRLSEDFIFYRAGMETEAFGQYFSFEKPVSIVQTRIDKALPSVWPDGNLSIIDTGFAIKVPKGSIVHVGDAAPQGGFFLGGTRQIFIEKPSHIAGVEIREVFSLVGENKYVRK